MKKLPTDDPLFGKGTIRADGRKLHNMYLFEVKKPDESKYPWDYYKLVKTIPPSGSLASARRGRLRFPQIVTHQLDTDRPVALVTGGGGDIGRAIALRWARTSKAVAIVDIDQHAADETARLVEAAGCRAMAIRADVASSLETAAFVEAIESGLGPIAIFANNAGIEGVVAPLHEYPEDTFDRLHAGQCEGRLPRPEICARPNDPARRRRHRQHGVDLGDPRPRRPCRLCRIQACRARPDPHGRTGSDGNTHPGECRSARAGRVADDPGIGPCRPAHAPPGCAGRVLRHYGRPENIADVVAFLASGEAAHVNGAAWVVDAGTTVG